MIGAMTPIWQKAAQIFHERAAEYDGWFDTSVLFKVELAALHDLTTPLAEPKVEVGVGPGRFAREMGVVLGIDPAFGALELAKKRVAGVCQGVGEELPMGSSRVGTVFLLFTLCFTTDPRRVIAELVRIIRPGGYVVLGFIPEESPWGVVLRQKRDAGHPFYQHSRFYKTAEVSIWLTQAGLNLVETRSALFQSPAEVEAGEPSRSGLQDGAGFVLLVGQKRVFA